MAIDSAVSDLDDLIAASGAVRRRFEADAFLNIAFLQGKQWVAYDGTRLWEPSLEDWREKVTDNRIRPIIRTEIAKMTKTRPTFTCLPKTSSDQDMADARYGDLVLEDAWERHDLQRKLRQALLWSRVAMAGFWKVWWNSGIGPTRDLLIYGPDHEHAGRLVVDQYRAPVDPKSVENLPDSLTKDLTTKTVAAGEVCVDLRTFFQAYPDPHAGEEGLSGAEYMAEESIYTRKYMLQHFDPALVDELTFDANPTSGASEMRGTIGMTEDPRVPNSAKGIKVREVWTKEHHVIWTEGDRVLLEEDNPYPWLPYTMFGGTPVPGRFWPDSVVTDLRPRQVDLNKRLSQIAENAERIANPPLLVPSTIADEFEWQGLPGEMIIFTDTGSPNAMPQFLPVPELPGYVQNDPARTEASLMELSGQHEVSGAQVPAGVTAASAINLLQEQDDTRLGPDIAAMETTLAEAGTRILWLVDQYYDERRHIQIAGEDGTWDMQEFKSGGVKGAKDVRVQAGSAMPQSKAAKQAALQQIATLFAQNGQQISQRAWHKILEQYEIGGLSEFFASVARDERQISEENRRLARGDRLPINAYDNDEAHVEGHEDYQKSAAYADLPNPVKQRFEQHVTDHRTRQATKQLNQQPPPGPPGSTPQVNGAGGGMPPGLAEALQGGSAPGGPVA